MMIATLLPRPICFFVDYLGLKKHPQHFPYKVLLFVLLCLTFVILGYF